MLFRSPLFDVISCRGRLSEAAGLKKCSQMLLIWSGNVVGVDVSLLELMDLLLSDLSIPPPLPPRVKINHLTLFKRCPLCESLSVDSAHSED